MSSIAEIVHALEQLAPPALAEPWDNVGLLLGDALVASTKVLLTIDLTPEIAVEAQTLGAKLVIAYHPPLFKPVRRMLAGDLAFECLSRGLAVYSPHTALDAAEGGTNDTLCSLLSLEQIAPLKPHALNVRLGAGRIGETMGTRDELVKRVKARLDLPYVWVAGPHGAEPVKRVATCAGSGAGLLTDAMSHGADVYLVGELSHHEALSAVRAGMTVIMTGHSNTERMALEPLRRRLEEKLPAVHFVLSKIDRDPYRVL
jgi:dinuclear metal center YbgI/SA1388 family protein